MTYADELELYMLELINQERVSRGLTPLQLEVNLNQPAESHWQWMLANNQFSHTGAGNSSVTQRMISAGFDLAGSYGTAENIAIQSSRGAAGYFDDVLNLHNSLMASDGHRANILNPSLQYIGLGVEIGSFTYSSGFTGNSVIVTQNFGRTQGDVDLDDLNGGSGPVFVGTANADNFTGTAANDDITGNGGNDILNGGGGEDTIGGGAGLDVLSGGAGADIVYGNRNADTLNGGGGSDSLYGGNGRDVIFGDSDNDLIYGGNGADILHGGSGADELFGQAKGDTLNGNAGDDSLAGGNGSDTLNGGADKDELYGGAGSDMLFGDAGDDQLFGKAGTDILDGGSGDDMLTGGNLSDTFVFGTGYDEDTIIDFQNNVDQIDLSDFSFSSSTAALETATQVGGDLVFNFGGGDVLTIENTTVGQVENDLIIA